MQLSPASAAAAAGQDALAERIPIPAEKSAVRLVLRFSLDCCHDRRGSGLICNWQPWESYMEKKMPNPPELALDGFNISWISPLSTVSPLAGRVATPPHANLVNGVNRIPPKSTGDGSLLTEWPMDYYLLGNLSLYNESAMNVSAFDGSTESSTLVAEWVRDISLGIVLAVLSLLTFIGNAMVLHAVRTEKRLQTVCDSQLWILSLESL